MMQPSGSHPQSQSQSPSTTHDYDDHQDQHQRQHQHQHYQDLSQQQQHHSNPQNHGYPNSPNSHPPADTQPLHINSRKRKADSHAHPNNERLSKRLSLLNLENNGAKLYVPVETPSSSSSSTSPRQQPPPLNTTSTSAFSIPEQPDEEQEQQPMHLDDTKHKVYIYNIDDELSSASDSEPDDGRLVFLPDIERHLRQTRIPPSVLANSEGELAGMQMVLYSDPKSLSVPEEQDGVRKAVLDARRRLRTRQNGFQQQDAEPTAQGESGLAPAQEELDTEAMDMD